ncbi:class II aldolase/adducin family protein [Bosea sp. (in: a-proteobacteria)]|jgi:HCOMODA/2-hydroxy-3-carboxy-muconic semialdehyde decarboxylase|uniref:class II aldolase/adducin family protein n=1 Tax=Bosea sp. (in: a-proteobacteria) TaxID=1871050 RepID=UPI002DDD6877|nr:class II aldolase/adducin family protein [Bosea sp. (in: a-proteobacteria)]HEV2511997.1 class II aldolase/adducin family protein [Bosea sp. (in: a-proteobacteria)]
MRQGLEGSVGAGPMQGSPELERTVAEIVDASRILAHEGIIDSFGHVSARHPNSPGHYLMPRTRAAELVGAEDILIFDLDDALVSKSEARIFAERSIHGAIYRARPDVVAVCHHHAPQMMPFCTSDAELVPVFHLGATMGATVPLWDSQDEFGDTNLIVSTRQQGDSLARTLGANWTVLMRGHGATVAGRSVRELTFRSIYGARNADVQLKAAQVGTLRRLTAAEAVAASDFNLTPFAMDRAWEQWTRRVRGADEP